jgi:hypothetical protein
VVSPATALSPPARRIVALALLALVVTVLVQLVVRPLTHAYDSRRTSMATLERQLVALERLAASREAVERRLQRARQRQELEGFAFRAANASRAAGLLQQHVTQTITTAGGRVSSIQVLPGEEYQGIFRMTARVTTSTDTEGLAPVLHALEGSMPWLVVRKLGVTSRAGRLRRKGGRARGSTLTLSMDVTGFLAIDAGDAQ